MQIPSFTSSASSSMAFSMPPGDPGNALPSTGTPSVPAAPLNTDASGPATAESGRNTLALISLILSLIFPLAAAINLGGAAAVANHLIPQRALGIFLIFGGALGTFGLPAMISAIVTGHVALVIARRFSRRNARRWMAIFGLVLGYLSLVIFVGILAVFIIAGMNGF